MKLYPIHEVLAPSSDGALADGTSSDTTALRTIAEWCRRYLCEPHPSLGRPGVVCPWSPPSIKHKYFWLSIQRSNGIPLEEVERAISERGELMRSMEPTTGRFASLKTIVTIFPDLDPDQAPAYINGLHAKLKPNVVKQGSMLGEFYQTCSKPGLRNPDFLPLQSPIPLLVLRDLVLNDIVFLADKRPFAEAYLRKHALRGCDEIFRLLNQGAASGLPFEQLGLLFEVVHAFLHRDFTHQDEPLCEA